MIKEIKEMKGFKTIIEDLEKKLKKYIL